MKRRTFITSACAAPLAILPVVTADPSPVCGYRIKVIGDKIVGMWIPPDPSKHIIIHNFTGS